MRMWPVLRNEATHDRGGTLDLVFRNQRTTTARVARELDCGSDHRVVWMEAAVEETGAPSSGWCLSAASGLHAGGAQSGRSGPKDRPLYRINCYSSARHARLVPLTFSHPLWHGPHPVFLPVPVYARDSGFLERSRRVEQETARRYPCHIG